MQRIELAGQAMLLLPQKGILWVEARTLIVADLHLGKTATFRRSGIPVPEGSADADLERLGRMLDDTGARKLIILGDFFHAKLGRSVEVMQSFERWRAARTNLDMLLIRGNHDYGAGDPPSSWGIHAVHEPASEGPFRLYHHAPDAVDGFAFAGHVHPTVVLHGSGGSRMRVPCYWIRSHSVVLPAFGSFTGGYDIRPAVHDRIFAVGPGEVLEIQRRLRSSALKK